MPSAVRYGSRASGSSVATPTWSIRRIMSPPRRAIAGALPRAHETTVVVEQLRHLPAGTAENGRQLGERYPRLRHQLPRPPTAEALVGGVRRRVPGTVEALRDRPVPGHERIGAQGVQHLGRRGRSERSRSSSRYRRRRGEFRVRLRRLQDGVVVQFPELDLRSREAVVPTAPPGGHTGVEEVGLARHRVPQPATPRVQPAQQGLTVAGERWIDARGGDPDERRRRTIGPCTGELRSGRPHTDEVWSDNRHGAETTRLVNPTVGGESHHTYTAISG